MSDDAITELLKSMEGGAKLVKPTPKPRPREFISIFDVLNMPDMEWMVQGLIPEKSFGVFWGEPGSLKSFGAIDLAFSFATRRKFLGSYEVPKHQRVAYVLSEGHAGVKERIAAWMQENSITPEEIHPWFRLSPHSYRLDNDDDRAAFIDELKRAFADDRPNVVMVDTLGRNMEGNESDTKEMNALANALCDLSAELGITIILIHHCGKDKSRGMRGGSGLPAACDFHVQFDKTVSPGGVKTYKLVHAKVKEEEDGQQFELIPKLIELPNGRTSLVIRRGAQLAGGGETTAKGTPHMSTLSVCMEPKTVSQITDETATKDTVVRNRLKYMMTDGYIDKIEGNGTRHNPTKYETSAQGILYFKKHSIQPNVEKLLPVTQCAE